MLTVGSLFSGIGGIELGLERTKGFRTIWFVEKDEYCQAVIRKHWSGIPIYSDIQRLDFSKIEKPDMLTGGFPCQPISLAGKRKGKEDERWLWPEYARAIRILRPRLALMENVSNLTNFNGEFGQILGNLAEIGYDSEWKMLSADWFGPPQQRRRLFIIAYPAQSSESTIFHKDPINVECNRERFHVESGGKTNFNHENNRTGTVPLLGNPAWSEIPYRERSGNNSRIPFRVDRLRCLGNAVVPQVAEAIGQMILEKLNRAN